MTDKDKRKIEPSKSGLIRAISITEAITDNFPKKIGVSDISRQTGISKAVAQRMLKELVSVGMLSFDDEQKNYSLGSLALRIGIVAMTDMEIEKIALPYLKSLSLQTGETATLSLLQGNHRIYVQQVASPQEISMTVSLGLPYPLYAGASSKVILASFTPEKLEKYLSEVDLAALTDLTIINENQLRQELSKIKKDGYSISYGERHSGSASVAAVILGHDGDLIGSISISGPINRFPETIHTKYGKLIRETADLISFDSGFRPSK